MIATRVLARALVALAGAPVLVACSTATRARNVEEIVAGIPDSAMRQRWREAAARGQLPSLKTLPVAERPVTTRRRVIVPDAAKPAQGPLIPQQAVADVRVVGLDTLSEYRGPITIRDTAGDRLRGDLGPRGPIEIAYKLPGNQRLAIAPGALQLAYRQDVENMSLRRELLLTAASAPVLMYVSDGSRQPYDRSFPELGLRVRQTDAVDGRMAPVEITYSGQPLTMRPGDRRRIGAVELFVLSSYYLRREEIETAEGDPYHVTFMLYRPR